MRFPRWVEKSEDRYDWLYHNKPIDEYETVVLFPMGVSDERFYLNGYWVAHHLGYTSVQETLVYETLRKGAVSLEWKVYLDRPGDQMSNINLKDWDLGTMELTLARMGLVVRGHNLATETQELRRKIGLAVYKYHFDSPSMEYYYINKDGVESPHHVTSLPQPNAGEVTHYKPPFSFPFPVSPEEASAIKEMAVKR